MLTFKPHAKPIYAVVFTPDGRQCATSSGDETVRVWNLDGSPGVQTFPGSQFATPVAISPDGRFLARGGYGVAVWELKSGQQIVRSDGYAQTLAFSPDGKEVAGFAEDKTLARWSLPEGKPLAGGWGGSREQNSGARFPAGAVAYSPDGTTIATSYGVHTNNRYNSHILLWDRKTGKPRGELVTDFKFDHPAAIAFSPDGSAIAGIYGPVLRVLAVTTGEQIAAIKPGKKHFKGLAFTPDGKSLIAVNTDAAARVYDVATWAETTGYEWQIGKLTAVAVAPDGLRAACGSDRGRVVVWDLEG